MDLQTPISSVSRSYKMYANRLEKLGIYKLSDFLFHIPFRYDDYSLISKIGQAQAGEKVTIQGTVDEIANQYLRKWKTIQKAKISDETGIIDVMWFNQPFIPKSINKGDFVSLSGKISQDKNKLLLNSPDYEVVVNNNAIHTGRLVPVYPETKGVSSKWLRRQVFKILEEKGKVDEYLPESLLKENNLVSLSTAIETIHFPGSLEEAEKARERLSFDELFKLQLSSLVRKKSWQKEVMKNPWEVERFKKKVDEFISKIPFKLTNAQKKALEEILKDISSQNPMNRLLEGDVGSGKTIVGTIAAYVAYLNGYQTAFMAPTEILATQHYKTVSNLLAPLGLKVEIITGSNKQGVGKDFDILIGTHTLIFEKVKFKKLGFVIIDEQQRFGVEQRAKIRNKGESVHLLTMTATPIPRTVALTMYGELDLSILDEMPIGRKLVKTWLVPPSKRDGAYTWIEKQVVKNKDQVFIVCPFIEESESMLTVKAATKEFERLSKEVFPNLRLGLLHGKQKAKEKNEILKSFREGKIDILVSTPVVEVGIDIPNATIMMIEEAERFGLAQLHQLRGRVGRGDKQSYCLLFTGSKNLVTLEKLKSLETVYSGAALAEIDLRLRGPGQIYGTTQHGIPALRVASFSDFDLIEKTKKEAEKIFPKISEFPSLMTALTQENGKLVSPD